MITVNDLVKSYGYTRDRLTHFEISIWYSDQDEWATIKAPSADEYIEVCDRPIVDWMIEDDDYCAITVRYVDGDKDGILGKYFQDVIKI